MSYRFSLAYLVSAPQRAAEAIEKMQRLIEQANSALP